MRPTANLPPPTNLVRNFSKKSFNSNFIFRLNTDFLYVIIAHTIIILQMQKTATMAVNIQQISAQTCFRAFNFTIPLELLGIISIKCITCCNPPTKCLQHVVRSPMAVRLANGSAANLKLAFKIGGNRLALLPGLVLI